MNLTQGSLGFEKMVARLAELRELRGSLDEAQCSTCERFDTTHPAVIAHMEAIGRPLVQAACECAENAELVERKQVERIHDANLPHERDGHHRSMKNFEARDGSFDARKGIDSFCREEGPQMLTLTGHTGTGKSHLLEAAGRAYLGRGRSVRYEYVPQLIEHLRAANSPTAELDFHEVMEQYRRYHLLILDDLGERTTEFGTEALTSLVEDRMTNGGRLLVATNLVQDDVAHHYGHRLASRLWDRSDTGRSAVVSMGATTDKRTE